MQSIEADCAPSSRLQALLNKLKLTEFPMAQRELRTHSGGDKDGLCRANTLSGCFQRVRKQATVASLPASLWLSWNVRSS